MKPHDKVPKKVQKQPKFVSTMAPIQEETEQQLHQAAQQVPNNNVSALLQKRRNRIYRGR